MAAVLGALLTTWVTFAPCFVFIFLGAPYVERLRGNRALSSALTGITAAVVGVVAILDVFFALHTLFGSTERSSWGWLTVEWPVLDTLRWVPLAIGVVAGLLIFRWRWSVLRTMGLCALLGLAAGLAGLPVAERCTTRVRPRVRPASVPAHRRATARVLLGGSAYDRPWEGRYDGSARRCPGRARAVPR